MLSDIFPRFLILISFSQLLMSVVVMLLSRLFHCVLCPSM